MGQAWRPDYVQRQAEKRSYGRLSSSTTARPSRISRGSADKLPLLNEIGLVPAFVVGCLEYMLARTNEGSERCMPGKVLG